MYYRMCSIRYMRPERAIKGAVEVAAEKKRFSTRDKAERSCLLRKRHMSCGFLRDKPSMEETLRPLLWEDASSVCGSNLHFCTQNKLNIKIKSGNAKKWICSVEIFFFFKQDQIQAELL